MIRKTLVFGIIFLFASAPYASALPITDQTGNLLVNGNFENGETGWKTNKPGLDYLEVASDPLIEGDATGHVSIGPSGGGVYDYSNLAAGTYTVSGWFFVECGTANFYLSNAYVATSVVSTTPGEWEYLEVTKTFAAPTYGGAKLYGTPGTQYYADGIWLNAGVDSTSPFDPSSGYRAAVPEPSTLLLLGSGILGVGLMRKKRSL